MFALPTPTACKVRTFSLNDELHGEDKVHAMNLGIRVTGPNSLLDLLHSSLREMLFLPPLADQASIPGETAPWTVLRCDGAPGVAVKHELIGRNVTLSTSEIESEMSRDDLLELTECRVNKFHVTAYQGGTVDIDFRVQCSNVDREAIGRGGAMMGQDGKLSITHTELAPNQAEPTASPPRIEGDATTLFVDSNMETDKVDLSPEANWPFPKGHVATGAPPKLTTKDVTGRAGKQPAKYRDAATGETWSGRGLMPAWLKAAMKRGKKLTDFEAAAAH